MDILDGIYHYFLRFFSWAEVSFLFTGSGLLIMLNLVLSEGLLSFDNALVLALLVSHLSRDRQYRLGPIRMSIQQWALTAGIFGAYFFRVIAIGLGIYLIQFWFLQLIGGGYLLWLAYGHFFIGEKEEDKVQAYGKGFWGTVLKVETMDVAFSIDSILAALGISKRVWVILTGGMLGILCMRLVAGVFVRLIDRFPLFMHTGYALVCLIGYRLVSEVNWGHFVGLFAYVGPAGVWGAVLLAVVIWVTALKVIGLRTIRNLLQLATIILFFSWSGTKLHIHMSDLTFSIIMLGTFASTFGLNGAYVRWQELAAEKRAETVQADQPEDALKG